jgi:2-polyprenyl-3-methyl-5-hydroxy-6-metoxy-1,4-benzoquinol methylase
MTDHDGSDHAERFVPEEMGGTLIEAEHQARYRLALNLVPGRRVLDAGCGVGWGSELLRLAGAESVVGVDLSEDALADARRRAPACEFVPGDLQKLPFEDGEFDVVVCMEALEHTMDTGSALDELARVLRPDGILLVSSPNPGVYEAGNPFHLHELTADELHHELAARFSHTRLLRQYRLLASAVLADGARVAAALEPFELHGLSVARLAPGAETYSVVVGTHAELPELHPWAALAPATQLTDLATERREILAQLSAAHAQLRDADHSLRSLMTSRDEAFQQAADLQTRWEATDVQLRHLRLAFENAGRERDELTVRLLHLEQRLAGVPRPGATVPRAELNQAERRAEELRAKLRQRRGTRQRLRAWNAKLREQAQQARAEADEARAALAARVSLPRRVVRRLRSGRAKSSP